MKNKLLILFGGFLLLFLIGLFSCVDNCGPFPNKYKIVGLNWVNYKAIYSENSDPRLSLNEIENDSVDYDSYSILIIPEQETFFAQNNNSWNFSWIQTAKACSPITPMTDEKIDRIFILSEKDFDPNHRSGTDLGEFFEIIIFDYANGIYHEKYSLEDYLATNPTVPNEMTLILKTQPAITTDFQFLVKFYTNGVEENDYFEFTTDNIVIKRHK